MRDQLASGLESRLLSVRQASSPRGWGALSKYLTPSYPRLPSQTSGKMVISASPALLSGQFPESMK